MELILLIFVLWGGFFFMIYCNQKQAELQPKELPKARSLQEHYQYEIDERGNPITKQRY